MRAAMPNPSRHAGVLNAARLPCHISLSCDKSAAISVGTRQETRLQPEARGHAFMTQDLSHGVALSTPTPDLPQVSVVVVNYNYGRFLKDAVASVFGQSYASVQCIVVDNASTDETPAVLADLRARYDDLTVVQRRSNDGQTPASLDGLAVATGHYVIFLDADDYLLPHCVETHVYVHLSMRVHVGFTSGDMLQVVGREVVVSTGEESNRYVRSGQGRCPKLVRPYTSTPGWPALVPSDIASRIHYVPPLKTRWIWAPTSGLCYRRDALLLFADNPKLATLRTGDRFLFRLWVWRPFGRRRHRRAAVRVPHPWRQHLYGAPSARPHPEFRRRGSRRQQYQGAALPDRSPRRPSRPLHAQSDLEAQLSCFAVPGRPSRCRCRPAAMGAALACRPGHRARLRRFRRDDGAQAGAAGMCRVGADDAAPVPAGAGPLSDLDIKICLYVYCPIARILI